MGISCLLVALVVSDVSKVVGNYSDRECGWSSNQKHINPIKRLISSKAFERCQLDNKRKLECGVQLWEGMGGGRSGGRH